MYIVLLQKGYSTNILLYDRNPSTMSFVSTQQLEKLRCLKCRKYLSHFPIYQSFDQKGCICSRCPVEGNTARNTMYEKIAIQQQFPCTYDQNGCLDTVYPEQVPFHEKFCKFRPHDCPTTNCKWKGLVKDMWDHFNKQHTLHTIIGDTFEVDFVTCYNENFLLNVDEELYIVNQNNSDSNQYSCNVFYIGSNIHIPSYTYKLTLQDKTNKDKSFEVSKNLEEETVMERGVILETFEDPSAVAALIRIVKPDTNSEDQYEKVEWEMLRELECICCLEYMLPPIQQCVTGHSICYKCKVTQTICPECKAEFKDTVNLSLGGLVEHLIYPCKNNSEGCKFTCKAKDIREHEANCNFGKFKCPLHDYENCQEEMSYAKLYDHILSNHAENLLELDTVCIPFMPDFEGNEDKENIKKDCLILRYDFQLFKLSYKYENGIFSWEMQLIGTANDEKYDFEIDAVDFVSKQRVTFKKECSLLGDKNEVFTDDKFFISINLKQIGYMVIDEFAYSVRILPKW